MRLIIRKKVSIQNARKYKLYGIWIDFARFRFAMAIFDKYIRPFYIRHRYKTDGNIKYDIQLNIFWFNIRLQKKIILEMEEQSK